MKLVHALRRHVPDTPHPVFMSNLQENPDEPMDAQWIVRLIACFGSLYAVMNVQGLDDGGVNRSVVDEQQKKMVETLRQLRNEHSALVRRHDAELSKQQDSIRVIKGALSNAYQL
jgi:hypothetical protein